MNHIMLPLALITLFALAFPNPIRLHVLADGDDAASQNIKLAVRDAVLRDTADELSSSGSRPEARRTLIALEEKIKQSAQRELARQGVDYGAAVSFGVSDFPDRQYGERFFPAGKYEALKITLGSGQGHNWWCVMDPPLCIGDQPAGEVQFKSALAELISGVKNK